MDRTGQLYFFEISALLSQTHTARYVHVDFVRGATNAYAVYGDINFYGE